jgi:hypothetical protein
VHAVFLRRKAHRAGLSSAAWQEHRGQKCTVPEKVTGPVMVMV